MMQTLQWEREREHSLLEYGESRDGYWTGNKFMKQMESAVRIAEDYRLFWVFDQSGCHMAFDEDSLNVNRMNAGPGGSVPCMHDTTYKGKTMYVTKEVRKDGCLVRIPRGLRDILEQRGRYTPKMKLADMLASHSGKIGYNTLFSYSWSEPDRTLAKRYNYNITRLRKNTPTGLDSVSNENITNYFRRARNYMYGYLLGQSWN